jgi:hypothetical protein
VRCCVDRLAYFATGDSLAPAGSSGCGLSPPSSGVSGTCSLIPSHVRHLLLLSCWLHGTPHSAGWPLRPMSGCTVVTRTLCIVRVNDVWAPGMDFHATSLPPW